MYERNLQFPEPQKAAIVWRYMRFAQFVDLLQRQKLFFCRLEKLIDPYEGFYSSEMRAALEWKVPKRVIKAAQSFSRRNYCVNCWHKNAHESAAMWAVYSGSDGVAIRSTVARMQKSLHNERRNIFISNVFYGSVAAPAAAPLALKRKSFEHEKEVRMWCLEPDRSSGQEHGVYISVDLEILIEAVFVSPTTGSWITQVVQSLLTSHGFGIKPVQSGLYSKTLV